MKFTGVRIKLCSFDLIVQPILILLLTLLGFTRSGFGVEILVSVDRFGHCYLFS